MPRILGRTILGAVVCSAAMLAAASAQETAIKGGIEGKIKKVDVDAKTLTITTEQGKDRTFNINDETTMVGPRGGKVRHRLGDPRFHPGMSLTVVAEGNTATEIHLGFQHRDGEHKAATQDTDRAAKASGKAVTERPAGQPANTQPRVGKAAPVDEDEDHEVPGKVKRFDPQRRILVVTLLNGKDRSFLLARDVKVLVKGAASRQGLEDPALQAGASIEVITDQGGRRVLEVKILPTAQHRKAG